MSEFGRIDFAALGQQARRMQSAVAEAAEDLSTVEATGYGADGRIAATVSAQGRAVALRIDPSVIDPGHPEALAEQILAALDSAHEAVSEQRAALMAGVTGGLGDLIEKLNQPAASPTVLPRTPNRGQRPAGR